MCLSWGNDLKVLTMYFKLVVVIVSVLNSKQVFGHYDDFTTPNSYDLEVPGSDPIRIIEAEPLWDRNPQDLLVPTTERPWSDFEHRALRPVIRTTTIQTKTNINSPQDQNDEQEKEDTSLDSAEELTKFLKGYAEQLRRTTKSPFEDVAQFDSSERFHKVELITKPSEEPTNRLASLFLSDKGEKKDDDIIEDNAKTWNLLNLRRQKHPSDDKNGWVSLEVVPWSVSKVAKWHSNKVKPNSEEKPLDDKYLEYGASPSNYKPTSNQFNKPYVNYRPGSSNYYSKPFQYGSSNIQKPNPRPAFSPSSTTFAQKVYVQPEYTDETPRPSWQTHSTNHYDTQHDHHSNDPNCDYGHQGIITDGLPANFPKPHQDHNRRKISVVDDEHPASHPFNGDGEWVLLTTTKGYKPPSSNSNGRQRSLDIDSDSDLDKESISTHKSVRLTVLPPLKDSKINMTTSHGGLLQVESTFQTVDEAHKMSLKKENMKRRPAKRRPLRRPLKQTSVVPIVPTSNNSGNAKPAINTRKTGPNASTVLAAVGAGMIPATMAMLVPMMGKRRKRDLIFSTRSPNVVGLKLQLPHSF